MREDKKLAVAYLEFYYNWLSVYIYNNSKPPYHTNTNKASARVLKKKEKKKRNGSNGSTAVELYSGMIGMQMQILVRCIRKKQN